jgi:hypothetical protein
MTGLRLAILGLLLTGAGDREPLSSYLLPVTRGGVTTRRVAANFWAGEYPQPVIDVRSRKEGTTRVTGFASLRELTKPRRCTIQNGIYHPWSSSAGSLVTFYRLTAERNYQAIRGTQLGDAQLIQGARLERVFYLSEGYCRGSLTEGSDIAFRCSELDHNADLVREGQGDGGVAEPDEFEEQWLYLRCSEGYDVFISDGDLLATSRVKEGKILRYGAVGPADDH